MFSRGSINGATLDSWPLNGGQFVQSLASDGAIMPGLSSLLAIRIAPVAQVSLSLPGTAQAVRRIRPAVSDTLRIPVSAQATRRIAPHSAAPLTVVYLADLRISPHMAVDETLRVLADARLSFVYLRPTDERRRHFVLKPRPFPARREDRLACVPPDRRRMVIARERRE